MRGVAFYFGSLGDGHYLYDTRGEGFFDRDRRLREAWPDDVPLWSSALMDTGLLKNGQHPDNPDGRVFWTCGKGDWLAFFWWDRSGDRRGNSNSGFYVHGFDWERRAEAFAFACAAFPVVVTRQRHPLVLQS